MKKIIFGLFIITLLFSCSSSDDSSQSSSSVLLKKEIWSDGTIRNYSYQGNKLLKITGSDGSYSNYTYTGDLISKVEFLDPMVSSSLQRYEFYYSGNDLIQRKEYVGSVLKRKIDYVINSDNTKKRTHTLYNGTNTTTVVYKEYFSNGNQIKEEKLNSIGSVIYTAIYTYDNKNYPTKNILGYNIAYSGNNYPNNLIKIVETSSGFNDVTNYSFVYNSNNYPTQETWTDGVNTEVTQYFY
jgi:hypothetical protein